MAERQPIRLVPPVWLVFAIGLMAGLDRWLPLARVLPATLRYSGIVVVAAGIALILWAAVLLRRAGTPIDPFGSPSALLSRGPYRYSRNPIYLSMTLVLCGVALMLGSLSPWLGPPAFLALIERLFVRGEEARLEHAFGPDYRAFARSVRRWL